MSSMSWAVTTRSSACRRAATCRLNGLPGPPLLPRANLPLLSRPGWGCCGASGVAVWVVMADTPERTVDVYMRSHIRIVSPPRPLEPENYPAHSATAAEKVIATAHSAPRDLQ